MNNIFENGRSMVEMLGVLAVIGVLSIGGVAGYSYAMDKSRANRTLNDIRLRAVILQTQHATGRALDLSEYADMNTTYNITKAELTEGGYGLIVEGVPQRVCQMMYEGLSNWADTVKIGETVMSSPDACVPTNTMTIAFNPEMQTGGATEGDTNDDKGKIKCPDGYYPWNGGCYQCGNYSVHAKTCGPEGITCAEGAYLYNGACTGSGGWNACAYLEQYGHGYCTSDGSFACNEGYVKHGQNCLQTCDPYGVHDKHLEGDTCVCNEGYYAVGEGCEPCPNNAPCKGPLG